MDCAVIGRRHALRSLLARTDGSRGIESRAPALGRPTCMALSASLQHGAILSFGCTGNRVYTDLGEDEMYFVLRGKDLAVVADSLTVIASANAALNDYAKGRRPQLARTSRNLRFEIPARHVYNQLGRRSERRGRQCSTWTLFLGCLRFDLLNHDGLFQRMVEASDSGHSTAWYRQQRMRHVVCERGITARHSRGRRHHLLADTSTKD